MSVEYITHDLTATTRGVVAHGCNCQGKMGSGVAKAVRAKWPDVYNKYALLVSKVDDKKDLLGLAFIVNADVDNEELFVSNCFTQLYYGYDGKQYADAEAIYKSLMTTAEFCVGAGLPLYMHKIGSVRGGLSWENDVLPKVKLIDSHFIEQGTELEIKVCDL